MYVSSQWHASILHEKKKDVYTLEIIKIFLLFIKCFNVVQFTYLKRISFFSIFIVYHASFVMQGEICIII